MDDPAIEKLYQLEKALALLQAQTAAHIVQTETQFKVAKDDVHLAHAALNHRLETMNEFRQSIQDVISKLGKPDWLVLVTGLTVACLLIGGLWTVTGLKIDNALAPLTVDLARLHDAIDVLKGSNHPP